MRGLVVVSLITLAACQRSHDDKKDKKVAALPKTTEQIAPPFDIKTPPADAVKTSSGLIYKKLATNPSGTPIHRNDRVMINYTGWRQTTGDTFFSNRKNGQPMPLDLAATAPGFTEGLTQLKTGERMMLWIPPAIGYQGAPPQGKAETLVYEVEAVDVVPAPPIPESPAAPPADALTLPSGTKYVVVRPGTGTEKARFFDTLTFHYSAWDATGRMFDSTEMKKKPMNVPPYRQTRVMEEVLTSMTAGERLRFWVPSEKMQQAGRPLPGMPTGTLCYDLELLQIAKGHEPPPVPTDVAAPPAGAQKTAKGVMYKVLAHGKGGPHPAPTESVRVHYTGWTTDGRMFDSSIVKGEPAEFALNGVIAGWTDGLQVMSAGDKVRFWIPDTLAYKGNPGKPQGMLVFDIELLEIKPPAASGEGAPTHGAKELPAPPDVGKPPADAKTRPKGVFYKVLAPGKGGAHPTATDTVKVHYTGWTTDGKMFDSSVTRGEPAEFPLNRVIAGWTDAIPVMTVGEKARFWIPEALAYKGGGGPAGMLVFDVELLEIKPGS